MISKHRTVPHRFSPLRKNTANKQTRAVGPAKVRPAYTLVEILIAAALLVVLLTGVWSMFRMQQRTSEQGLRISREGRITRAIWHQIQSDLRRAAIAPSPGSGNPIASNDPRIGGIRFDSTINSAGARPADAGLPAPQFVIAGGSDWLVLDVYRDPVSLSQIQTLDTVSNAQPTISNQSQAFEPNAAGSSLASSPPTPFQRVMYVWLSSAEVEQISATRFGKATDNSQTSSDANPNANGQASSSADSPATLAASANNPFSQASEASTSNSPPRWLLRIETDWSWPRETDNQNQNAEDSADRSLLSNQISNDTIGRVETPASTNDQRRQWMESILVESPSPFIAFHQAAGAAQGSDRLASLGSNNPAVFKDGNSVANANQTDASSSAHLLHAQIDWLPEIVAGQFEYHNGQRWSASFTSSIQQPRPLAIRFQFQVDPLNSPVAVAFDQPSSIDSGQEKLRALDANLDALGPTAPSWDQATAAGDALKTSSFRPSFDHVGLFVFATQTASNPMDSALPSPMQSSPWGPDAFDNKATLDAPNAFDSEEFR